MNTTYYKLHRELNNGVIATSDFNSDGVCATDIAKFLIPTTLLTLNTDVVEDIIGNKECLSLQILKKLKNGKTELISHTYICNQEICRLYKTITSIGREKFVREQ